MYDKMDEKALGLLGRGQLICHEDMNFYMKT